MALEACWIAARLAACGAQLQEQTNARLPSRPTGAAGPTPDAALPSPLCAGGARRSPSPQMTTSTSRRRRPAAWPATQVGFRAACAWSSVADSMLPARVKTTDPSSLPPVCLLICLRVCLPACVLLHCWPPTRVCLLPSCSQAEPHLSHGRRQRGAAPVHQVARPSWQGWAPAMLLGGLFALRLLCCMPFAAMCATRSACLPPCCPLSPTPFSRTSHNSLHHRPGRAAAARGAAAANCGDDRGQQHLWHRLFFSGGFG